MHIFKDWTQKHTDSFLSESIRVKHRLSETGLFTDEALADLLDRHPSEKLDVCTMIPDHPIYPNKFRTGDFRDCDGKTLIEATKSGKIWINMREAMNVHAEYKTVLDQMYGAISEYTKSPTFHARGGILISSPAAKVPYHCDQTETILWHIRGKKRIYIYPPTPEFLPTDAYMELITNELKDDLPYNASMDASAEVFDLQEDEMASWQLNAPHRVDNQSYCVSVTTEFTSSRSALKNSMMVTDAFLKNKFGMVPRWEKASGTEKYVKSVFGRVLRNVGALALVDEEDLVTFKIDRAAKDYIVDIEPFERNF